ncbi:hypothetical protein M514_07179 [Trichuris suis]|uniref:DUF4371 domain-containing protein n=1 Tax=Trichuris suis TaxID=68888 RepID=A0A085NBZ2_9BILA|nr:hypothetical protein M514_07179 [Trichuris suis]
MNTCLCVCYVKKFSQRHYEAFEAEIALYKVLPRQERQGCVLLLGSARKANEKANIEQYVIVSFQTRPLIQNFVVKMRLAQTETVLHQRGRDVTNKIPLSNDTVQRRINAMAEDVEDRLCSWLRQSEFSLQVDESTLPGNEAVLLAYVRFIREEHFVEELLFSKELEADTRVVQEFFWEKGIPLQNIIAVATDGAPAMVGCHRGFISHLKKIVPNVLSIHCVLHRQHLVARRLSPRLNESLQYVINAVNKIKSNPLNDRLFRQLCDENNEEFNQLPLHTEIRWLSKGACLSRFFQLFDLVLQFFEEDDASLTENLRIRKADVPYLADLYFMFNEMNKQLLTEDLNLIKTKSVISAFMSKLLLFKRRFAMGELCPFQNLVDVKKEEVYREHLQALHNDFASRFEDILSVAIPDWVINPFASIEDEEISLQLELLDLQSNAELKPKLAEGYQRFWLQKQIPVLYPIVWAVVKRWLTCLPSSCLVERAFSVVTDLITKKRNRLQLVKRGDLRLRVTSISPNIDKLVRSQLCEPSTSR